MDILQGIKGISFDWFIIFIIGHILWLLSSAFWAAWLTDICRGICGMQHNLIWTLLPLALVFMCYLGVQFIVSFYVFVWIERVSLGFRNPILSA